MYCKTNKSCKGAVLLAVLVVAVVMVMLMGVATNLLQGRLSLAHESKQYIQDYAKVQAKKSELIYLLSTMRQTAAGISTGKVLIKIEPDNPRSSIEPIGDEIRVDGYQNIEKSGLIYSIQNDKGLLPINSRGQFWLKFWLNKKGYLPSNVSMYSDLLADYADEDNIRRGAGGEVSSYAEKSKFTPTNFLLQSCSELMLIKDWSKLLIIHPSLISQCSLRRTANLNLNAIPESLWRELWPSSANRVMSARLNSQWLVKHSSILKSEPSILTIPDQFYSSSGGVGFKLQIELNGVIEKVHIQKGSGKVIPFILKQ